MLWAVLREPSLSLARHETNTQRSFSNLGHPVRRDLVCGPTQLGSVITPVLRINFGYDERGNRNSVGVPNGTTRYTYDLANRLLTETNPLNQTTTFYLRHGG